MFKYLMAFLALVAVAFAVPAPEARPVAGPNPRPQTYVYGASPYAYSVPYSAYAAPAVYGYSYY